jgi:hypothetical protein
MAIDICYRIDMTCAVVFVDGGPALDKYHARALQCSHLRARLSVLGLL